MKRFVCLLPALLLSPALLSAQDAAAPATEQTVAVSPERNLSEMRVNVSISGDTPLSEAIDIVRGLFEASYSIQLNIVLPDNAAGIKVPDLQLHRVTLEQIFAVLKNSSPRGIDVDGNIGPSIFFECEEDPNSPESIWYLRKMDSGGIPARNAPQFYNLAPILSATGLKIDDISTALKEAWKLAGDGPDPAVTFHKETGLLVVAGEGAKSDMVASMLDTLRINAVSSKTGSLQQERDKMEQRMREVENEARMKTIAWESERKTVETAATRLQDENAKLREELRALQQQLVKMEAKLQSPAK